ncbi:MAG: prepilin peptidase [Hyphomicrobiaceae bacterium]
MAFAGAMDLFTMTIPNRISIGLTAAFLVAALMVPLGWGEIANHLGAGLLMLGVGIALFAGGFLGGGDAKLMAAAAVWFGFDRLLEYVVLVSISGGALVFLIVFYRSVEPPLWIRGQPWAMRLHEKASGVPYGIALAAGGLWLYPSTSWLQSLVV